MFNLIKKAILRNKRQAELEAELRLNDLCQRVGEQVAKHYGFRGLEYNVLAEVELLCRELGKGEL